MILAGDIGGTNARLGFFTLEQGRLKLIQETDYPSREHGSLDEIVGKFITDHNLKVERAGFGVAGPVRGHTVTTSNLPWVVNGDSLARLLSIEQVALVNDLEANTFGIAALGPQDFVVLNEGAPGTEGNLAVIAAGTGLGEAGAYWDGQRHHPFACEGGHADFAPRNPLEGELLNHLLRQYQSVSYERVLSGSGLVHIFQFLRDTGRGEEPSWLTEQMRGGDAAAAISRAALEARSEICMWALDLFISFYGAEAGNLALKIMATGGVFVGGGIAPKIIARLKGPGFMDAFISKGRMKPVLEAVPVRVILNDRTALLGAARRATLSGSDSRQ